MPLEAMHNKAKSTFGKKITVSFVVLNRKRVDSHVSSQFRNVCMTNTKKIFTQHILMLLDFMDTDDAVDSYHGRVLLRH